MKRVAALAGLMLAMVGCGLGESEVGCDFQADGEARCQARIGLPVSHSLFLETCEASGGVGLDAGCDLTNAVAGCYYDGPGEDVIDWYYPPETESTVQQHCDDDEYEFILP